MKIEFNQTTVTIAACAVMAVFMFGKDMIGGSDTQPQPRRGNMQVSSQESSEARFKRENRNIELPNGDNLSPDDIANRIKQETEIPFGDNEIEYSINMPKSWVKSNFAQFGLPNEEKYLILTNIARYFGPAIGDVRPFIWVEALRLKREITAQDFMYGYFANRGLSPETIKVHSEKDAEALFVEVQDNQGSYAVRGRFIINGDTMVLVKVATPIANYGKMKDLVGYIISSFDLKQTIDRRIEEKTTFKLLNVLSFDHLTSWMPARVERSSTIKTGMDLQNIHKDGGLNGVIYLRAYRKIDGLDRGKVWSEIEEFLSDRGFSILEEKEPADFKQFTRFDGFPSFSQKTYDVTFKTLLKETDFGIDRGTDNLVRQTMHVTRMDNGNYITYAILVTPENNKYYMTWAQNMFAYNLLLETIAIQEKAVSR